MKEWDVFISHASEDKEAVAMPLAQFLSSAGLDVWLDAHELRLGDSIREKIDQGLARSRFGVVILSKAFFEKRWPARELNALFALEEGGQHVILPVWHEVDQPTVAGFSPMIADRLAADTKLGVIFAAATIIKRIVSEEGEGTTALRKFIQLFECSLPQKEAIRDFLYSHPTIVAHASNEFASKVSGIHISPIFDNYKLDFAVDALHGSTIKVAILSVIQLSTPQPSLFDEGLRLTPEVNDMLEELKAIVSQLRAKQRNPRPLYRIEGVLVAGRRLKLRDNEKTTLKSLNDSHDGVTIRTYDWFIDAAARYFNPSQMWRYMDSRHAINTSLDSFS